ncbi:MAG: TetR/AcrR family transcriptional regulator [Bacteroidales bacterium]|nr:TetR/AcrR family transcriptional regulator [Bacteroidales bacterium]HPD94914.1 TetR/AcrR family transcriptional regulator [Tenuifilaceae bacterium]HRX30671.1 TetR/AcrR family transcriptional regulator [Tenuifilaceae bacterium]
MSVKDQIVEGALALFRQMGIRGVTMDMIAENLGMSKRTLYENYPTKDALIESCLQLDNQNRKDVADEILKKSTHMIETYILFMWFHVKQLRAVNPLFIHDIRKYYPNTIYKKVDELNDRIRIRIVEFINKGKKEGVFRDDVNSEIAAYVLMDMISPLNSNALNNRGVFQKFMYADIFEHIAVNFIRGISTKEGIELVDFYYSKHKLIA